MLKVAFGMIIFNGNYVLRQALEAVYPYASQILIAEGPVSYWQSLGYTTSTDDTNEILHSFPDPEHKIIIVHGQFSEKDEQCQAYMKYLKEDTDYLWSLDSDEIFKFKDIETIVKLVEEEKYTSVGVKSCSFYGGFDRYIGGFEELNDQFIRIFKVCPGVTWATHRPPTIKYPENSGIIKKHLSSDILFNQTGIRMYHYSYLFPDQVYNKISYYKNALTKEKCIDNYFRDVYLKWVKGNDEDKKIIEQKYNGVHEYKPEYRAETLTKPFLGHHPEVISKNICDLKNKFNEQLKKYY